MVDNTRDSKKPTSRIDTDSQLAPEETGSVGIDRQIEKLEIRRSLKELQRSAGNLMGQRVRGVTEKLLTRTLSGVVYAAIVLAALFVGKEATIVLIAGMGWLCCSEFFHICRMGGRMPNEPLGLVFSLIFPIIAYFGHVFPLAFSLLLIILCGLWYVLTPRANLADVAVTAFGPLYTSLSLSTVVLLRSTEPSFSIPWITLAVMLSVWANDSFAYLFGSKFGKHKLAPRISPNKSWEGFYGGLLGSMLVWFLIAVFGAIDMNPLFALLFGVTEGIFSVVGDLFESRIKRGVGLKDSGSIMPGHGGLLDRTDSMIFGTMAAFLLFQLAVLFSQVKLPIALPFGA